MDRKSHDRQKLFKGTFEALADGHAVALFPEGTSYTEPSIAQVKDGASRAALEYVRWARETRGGQGKRLQIVPVGIVWTDKTQFQSKVSAGVCGGARSFVSDVRNTYAFTRFV